MELIIHRLRNLGFEIKIVTQMVGEENFFHTHIEAHQNGGAYKSAGFLHRITTPPESELRMHLQRAEKTIEQTVTPKENVLKSEPIKYRQFNELLLNWVPVGDLHNPNA